MGAARGREAVAVFGAARGFCPGLVRGAARIWVGKGGTAEGSGGSGAAILAELARVCLSV